ncbi:MAG: tRNA (N(6)-L-threonylcarbamoyladenosine(37)-C(2))-methylthiotransferase MtaB, partial [Bacteroidales bacterium]|nr:tRNA (N(6)-L-threonylcarbamoyladenosine(37)-C(2))-methylthiotransferase MtaB [Bacteroidales bacterium]
MTFNIYTLGCKLNFSESSDIARQLKSLGFIQSNNPEVVIINSCAVTSMAVKKTRNLVARHHKKNPDSRIVVIGCYGALQAAEIAQWKGVTAVFGSADKTNVIPYLMGRSIPDTPDFVPAYSSGDRTRSFLKIQDGCDYHCTYCTVAKARGASRSNSIDHVLQQLK